MRKILSLFLSIAIILTTGINAKIDAASNGVQAAWLTTAWSLDWPKTKNNSTAQKKELIKILDTLKDTGINTVMFQVRPYGDAMYKSSINPWSKELTGTQGKDTGYDPLAFIIQEAHTRGMKVHAWLNPYRVVSSGTDVNVLSSNHLARQNPSLLIENRGGLYYNPDLQEVKDHISNTVGEIVSNYDIDGITFDDYFYPTDYPLPQGEDKDGLVRHGVEEENITAAWVPGAFEIPITAQKMAQSGKYDAVICVGAVIRGDTSHYDLVCNESAKGIAQIELATGIPVLFGIITTENIEQAIARAGSKAGNKGYDCALSAIEMVNLIKQL